MPIDGRPVDMNPLRESDLIYDWNLVGEEGVKPLDRHVELDDETLRDGLQSPSVSTPTIEQKLEILHLMVSLGIDGADIGLPAAGERVFADVLRITQEIVDQRLPIVPNAAARTVVADCQPIVEISQRAGLALEVAAFIGSSPIRQYSESWNVDRLLHLTEEAVSYCTHNGLPVMYVTEDTTRAHPDDLRRLYTTAVEAGARRVCVADTVGHATPAGARAAVRFVREVVAATGEQVKVDWHGHRDRGLDIANALAAIEAGAARIHGTALGVGERVGNTPMDLVLVNLHLLGWSRRDLTHLARYCHAVSEATGIPLHGNYPVFGDDAFRTATGVHASAIIKARARGDAWLADRVYSGVPAELFGCHQVIEVGPMSGESNVIFWLTEHGYSQDRELIDAIFNRAKIATRVLAEDEIHEICRQLGAEPVEPMAVVS